MSNGLVAYLGGESSNKKSDNFPKYLHPLDFTFSIEVPVGCRRDGNLCIDWDFFSRNEKKELIVDIETIDKNSMSRIRLPYEKYLARDAWVYTIRGEKQLEEENLKVILATYELRGDKLYFKEEKQVSEDNHNYHIYLGAIGKDFITFKNKQ